MRRAQFPVVVLLLAVVGVAGRFVPAPAEEPPLDRATSLAVRIRSLSKEGRQAEALPLAGEVLAILEAETGPESPEVATFLCSLAGLHDALEQYAAAVPLYARALAIREKYLGPAHADLAAVLANLAWDIDALGDPARALPYYGRALAIRQATLGPEHPDTAVAVNNLASCQESLGNHAAAKALYEQALAINEKVLGPKHPETANSLNNLAGVYCSLAAYAQARPLYQRALAIQEKALGPDHMKLAATLNNLAQLERRLGAYETARRLLERSLAIREKTLGPQHPETALGRNNLAGILDAQGEYDKAKPLYEQSLADLERALGPDHPHVAACLANLASVLSALGDPDAAQVLLERSLAIWEKARGPEGEDVATPLNNLALLHFARGEFDQARALLTRARAILEKTLGTEHPQVASLVNALAGVAQGQGDPALAKKLDEQALAIREKTLGPRHLETAISLANLAGVLADLGQRQQAAALYGRSLAIMTDVLGPAHPFTARVLNNLARVEAGSGNLQQAFRLMAQAQAIDAAAIEPVMAITSDAQKLDYLASLEASLHDFTSLVATSLADVPEARMAAFQAWLGRKGIVFEAQRRFQEALLVAADPETTRLGQELATVRGQLSRLTFAGPGVLPPEALRAQLEQLGRRRSELETRLSALGGRFAGEKKRAGATLAEVAANLPQGSVLLDFCRFEVSDFTAPKRKTGSWHYLVYVLAAGGGDRVAMVDLGDAEAIDRAIATLKTAIKNPADVDGSEAAKAGRGLYDLVMAPLGGAIGDSRLLIISPDGNLNLIPFEVLLGPDGRYLIEDFTCAYLSAGRDVLNFTPTAAPAGRVVLFGDPDFNRASPMPSPATPDRLDQEHLSRAMADMHFSRLPGTREEVLALAAIQGQDDSQLFLEGKADAQSLGQVVAPGILHLATHGFFLTDQKLSLLLGLETVRDVGTTAVASAAVGRPAFENPLLRSGLALAGANTALTAGSEQAEGGIVTAEKILELHLQGTDLVVLSACETGLGQVKAGEGVFGLRRAFAQAGAKHLVMSLWSVPDRETRELMVGFYRYMRQDGLGKSEALRRAALDAMAVARQRYGQPRPFFWGAFVLLGQP